VTECSHECACPCALPMLVLDQADLLACDASDPLHDGQRLRSLDPTSFRRELYDEVIVKTARDRTQFWLVMGDAASAYMKSRRAG
jgi:hypothetical protein